MKNEELTKETVVFTTYINYCTHTYCECPTVIGGNHNNNSQVTLTTRWDNEEITTVVGSKQPSEIEIGEVFMVDREYRDEYRGDHARVYYVPETHTFVISVGIKSVLDEIKDVETKIKTYFKLPYNMIVTSKPKESIGITNPIEIDYDNLTEDDEMCYSLDINPSVIDRWSLFKNDIINYNPSFNKLSQSSFNDSYIGHNKIDNFEVYLFQMSFYECGLSYNVYLNKRLIEIKPTNKEVSKNDFMVLLHYFLKYNISKFNGYSYIIYYGIKTDEMYRIDEVKFDSEDTINWISFVFIEDKENIEPIKLIR